MKGNKKLALFRKLFTFLKKPIVLGLTILILASLIVWIWGPLLAVGGNAFLTTATSRLFLIMIFVFVWGITNLFLYMHYAKKSKENAGEKEAIAAEAENLPEEAEYYPQLEQAFRKISRFSRKILPWHLVLGNAGSGKTSLLQKGTVKFKFPEGEKLTNIDVAEVCSWHLTQEKVFLELEEIGLNDAAPVWQDVLYLLRKYRRRNPLHGVTLVCSIAELIQKTPEERKAYAITLRQRIYDLHRRLGLRIPITLVFNQADLITGFKEYFEYLPEEDKQQVWGIKFADNVDVATQFMQGFNDMLARLDERLIARLHKERDDKRVALITSFPLQMAALKTILNDFVKHVAVPANFAETVPLIGTYFASALQSGAPIDVLLDSVANTFNLDKPKSQSAFESNEIAYFVNKLFAIEVNKTKPQLTVQMQQRQQRRLLWSTIAIGAIFIFIMIFWYVSYLNTSGTTQELNQNLSIVQDVEQLHQLDTQFAPWRHKHGLLGLYYSKRKLANAIHDAYINKLQQEFIPNVVYNIEQNLHNALQKQQELYPALKVYLMFGDPKHFDADIVKEWMAHYWRQTLVNPEARSQVIAQLDDALSKPLPAMKLNQPLIAQARAQLRSISIAKVAYLELSQQMETQNLPTVSLTIPNKDNFLRVFSYPGDEPAVSTFYTVPGYHKLYKNQYLNALKATLKGDWVLGKQEHVIKITPQMEAQMQELYFQDYINQWQQVLSKIHIIQCENIQQMNTVLAGLATPTSPLVQLIKQVNTHTNLSGGFLQTAAKKSKAVQKIIPVTATPVDKAFAPLRSLQVANIQKSLSAISVYMQKVNDGQTAFKAATELMNNNAQNPIVQLLQQADQAPEPVRHLLREVVHQSAALIFEQARPYINASWQADVYPVYNENLRGHYPFDQSADDEAAIADFVAFFSKQGAFGKFSQTYIKPFVQEAGGSLVWKTVVGQTIGFSNNTLSMLNRLNYIQNAYLAGGQKLAVTFTMQPITLNSKIASADVIIGDTTFTYKHGPRFPSTITWPGKAGGNVSVSFTGLDGGVYSVAKQGDWGLLRLFDQYNLMPKDSKSSIFHINMGSGSDASYMLRATSAYNPLNLTIIHGLKLARSL